MTTALERKALDRQARRRKIQDAARAVFSERGYTGASIEQIARASQLSVGAIYLYFRSKEDLYVSLIEEALRLFDAEFEKLAEVDAELRFSRAWAVMVAWAMRDPEGPRILRLLAQPGVRTQLSEDVSNVVSEGIKKLQASLATFVNDGVTAGHYRDTDPTTFVTMIWSLLLGLLDGLQIQENLAGGGDTLSERAQLALTTLERAMGANLPRAMA